MLDLEGSSLTTEEIELLRHPLTGGVILFSRNFESQPQIQELCLKIRETAAKPILIAVDHEGGRVQRFHEQFTKIPAMGCFRHIECDQQQILQTLISTGWLMASELIVSGIDISFAPVLDVDIGVSQVIGDRAFSDKPQQIIDYSTAFIKGMNEAGMRATGKHFPGHGSTAADSHYELPIDRRTMEQIRSTDLSVFAALSTKGLDGIMPAHVVYPEIDAYPASFSRYWLQDILRKELDFQGTIFSDDLSMAGAISIGDVAVRAKTALDAGCDMILCCNDRDATIEILDQLTQVEQKEKSDRVISMMANNTKQTFSELQSSSRCQKIQQMLQQI